MKRHAVVWVGLIGILLAVPTRAEDSVPELVRRLVDGQEGVQWTTLKQLLRRGDVARPILERLVVPRPKVALEPSAAQKAEIARLIGRLMKISYQERKKASEALFQLGRVTMAQLEAASRHGDPELRARARGVLVRLDPAQRIIDRLGLDGKPSTRCPLCGGALLKRAEVYGAVYLCADRIARRSSCKGYVVGGPQARRLRQVRVESARLLAEVGTRQSIPALRLALESDLPRLCAAAAYALRAILKRPCPPDDEGLWRRKRAEVLGAWRKSLARIADSPAAGAPATLALRRVSGQALRATIDCGYVRYTGFPLGRTSVSKKGTYQLSVIQDTLSHAVVAFEEYATRRTAESPRGEHDRRQALRRSAIAGRWPARPEKEQAVVWQRGTRLKLELDEARVLAEDGTPSLASTNVRQLVQFTMFLPLYLSGGRYPVGRERRLPLEFLVQLERWLYGRYSGHLRGSRGGLTYLGRRGGEDRYWLRLRFHRGMLYQPRVGAVQVPVRICLQGPLSVDPTRGEVSSFSLRGPVQELPKGDTRFTVPDQVWPYVRCSYRRLPDAPDGKQQAPK